MDPEEARADGDASVNNFPKYWRSSGRTYIKTPFERRFIEAIKDMIPRHARGYDPDNRVWHCTLEFEDAMLDAAHEYFGGLKEIPAPPEPHRSQKEKEPPPKQQNLVNDPRIVFVNMLTDDALKKAYKAMVVEFHPDRGGKNEDMTALNAIFAEVTRLRGTR